MGGNKVKTTQHFHPSLSNISYKKPSIPTIIHAQEFFKWIERSYNYGCCCHFNGKFTCNFAQQPQREKKHIKVKAALFHRLPLLWVFDMRFPLCLLESSVWVSIIIADVRYRTSKRICTGRFYVFVEDVWLTDMTDGKDPMSVIAVCSKKVCVNTNNGVYWGSENTVSSHKRQAQILYLPCEIGNHVTEWIAFNLLEKMREREWK